MYYKLTNNEIMKLGWLYSKIEDILDVNYDENRSLYKKACETPVSAIGVALRSIPRSPLGKENEMREITACISSLKNLFNNSFNLSIEFLPMTEAQQMIWQIGYFSAKNGDPMPEQPEKRNISIQNENQFKDIIVDFRKQHNLSQQDMANILNIDRGQLSKWESGKVIPYDVSIQKAMKAMEEYDSNFGSNTVHTQRVYIDKDRFNEYLNMDPKDFMDTLKEFRTSRYISQSDFANILGVQRTNFSRWECHKIIPSRDTITKILNKLIEYQEKEDSGQLE